MAEIFKGIITQIGIFPIKEEIKNQTVKKPGKFYGKQWNIDKTHTIALKVTGLKVDGKDYDRWITLRHQQFKPGQVLSLRLKHEGNWVDVWEGSEVLFFYNVNNGYVNIVDKDKFSVVSLGARPDKVYTYEEEESNDSPVVNKRDYTGVEVGHAINSALICEKYSLKNIGAIIERSKEIHDLTKKLKDEYTQKNTDMSAYDIGAMVGHSILNACRIGGDLEANARVILEQVVPVVSAYVKGETPAVSEPDTSDDIPF